MRKHILVAYFSASGETEQAAEALGKLLGADVHEIEPEAVYTKADLNWNNKQSRSSIEMNNQDFRPAMKETELDLSKYDEILVGFPIWWDIAPTIINTFMEHYDFTGKTVRAFATSGGSGIENGERNLKKQYPKLDWRPGKLCNSDRAIRQFADSIQ